MTARPLASTSRRARVTKGTGARASTVARVAVVLASFWAFPLLLGVSCTPVPIVGYDAAPVEGGAEGGDAKALSSDAADADADADAGEAGPTSTRREYDAGIEDDAFPGATDGELELRMKHLLEAIVAGDPALAPDLLYPRDAWVRASDAHDPGKAWDHKIKPVFLKDIAKLHKSIKNVGHAKFVSFELGKAITHAQPKARELKRPVWRVRHSKLTIVIDEKTKRIDISEMTAFRGAWYVTKLR